MCFHVQHSHVLIAVSRPACSECVSQVPDEGLICAWSLRAERLPKRVCRVCVHAVKVVFGEVACLLEGYCEGDDFACVVGLAVGSVV